jgi:hypothetical protein
VSRTTGLIADETLLVADDYTSSSTSAQTFGNAWHGRGTRVTDIGSDGITRTTWDNGTTRLSQFTVASAPMSATAVERLYPETFSGTNESIHGVSYSFSAVSGRSLSIFDPGLSGSAAPIASAISITGSSSAIGMTIQDGAQGITDFYTMSSLGGTPYTANNLFTSNARLLALREVSGSTTSFAIADGSLLSAGGYTPFTTDYAATLSVTYASDHLGMLVTIGGTPGSALHDYTFGTSWDPLAMGEWSASWNDTTLSAAQFNVSSSGFAVQDLTGTGVLTVTANPVPEPAPLLALLCAAFIRPRRR